jgi:hypothetical protein
VFIHATVKKLYASLCRLCACCWYRQVRKVIDEMNLWNELLGADAGASLTEKQVERLLDEGELPPEGLGALQQRAAPLQLGKDYYMASNDLAHCEEEVGYLREELGRLRAWVGYMLERCEELWAAQAGQEALQAVQAMTRDAAPSASATLVVTTHADAPYVGTTFHVWRHMQRLQEMKRQLDDARGNDV